MRSYSPDFTPPWKKSAPAPELPADPDLVVEEASTGFCGAVIRTEKTSEGPTVTLEDRFGKHRVFPMTPAGFLHEGKPVTLNDNSYTVVEGTAPAPAPVAAPSGALVFFS